MKNSGNGYTRVQISALVMTMLAAVPVQAKQWDGTVLGFEKPQQGLFYAPTGMRNTLHSLGFDYSAGYLSQVATNLGGGFNNQRKAEYIDQFAFTFTQNLESLTGIPDARIEGNIVNRNHNNNLTTSRVQNPSLPFNDLTQESWGGQSITRLGWLSFSRSFLDRRLSWRIGMLNKVQDFDPSIPCDFQLLTQCGGKSGYGGLWNNWNVHTWGTTLGYRLTPEITLKTGVLEQNPRASDRSHAWSWSTRGSRGVILPLELQVRTHVNNLPGSYNLGAFISTARQTNLSRGVSQTDGSSDPQGYRSYGVTPFLWGAFNQQITRHAEDATRGMSISGSGSLADQRSNRTFYSAAMSVRYRGLFDARPQDWLGVGVGYIKASRYSDEQLQQTGAGYPRLSHAVNAEIYYRFRLTSWLEIQPDLQYWHNPGADSSTRDAWVGGLKTQILF